MRRWLTGGGLIAVTLGLWLGLAVPEPAYSALRSVVSQGTLPRAICRLTGASVSAGADTTEDVLATCTVLANSLSANGYLRVRANYSASGAGGTRTVRVRFSGAGGTIVQSLAAATSVTDIRLNAFIRNANVTNSQVAAGDYISNAGANNSTKTTPAADTTADTTLVITCQKASAGDVCTLDQYVVELVADGT